MKEKNIILWPEGKTPLANKSIKDQKMPNMQFYGVENPYAAVIVCPGGCYSGKACHEGAPVAAWLNSIGISAFVLDYRVAPYRFPAPQLDAKRAIRYAKYAAESYGYPSDKIGIIGFSAGGHLAASCGTVFDELGYKPADEIDKLSSKPDFMILCYPVISFVNCMHYGSRLNLLGEVSYSEAAKYSLERRVTKETVPAFIWHTANDEAVPVENSLNFATELSKNQILFELHIFPNGPHGLGVAASSEGVKQWTYLCQKWLESIKIISDDK